MDQTGFLAWLRFIVDILVMVVAIGYWAGDLKSKKFREPNSIAPRTDISNGQPTIGELSRRLDKLEECAMIRVEVEERFKSVWHEINNIRGGYERNRRSISELTGKNDQSGS